METKILSKDNLDSTVDTTILPYAKVVEVYILNENKEFIIVFSALKDNFCKVLSGGVEDGESFEDAAIREAKEEINADIKIIGVSKHPFEYEIPEEKILENHFKSRGGKGKSIIAKLDPPNQRLKIQADEISGYKWINKDQIYNHLGKLDQLVQAEKIFKEFNDYF